MAAARDRGGKSEYRAIVFRSGGIYERKGDVGGRPRGPHDLLARPGKEARHEVVWAPRSPSSSRLRFLVTQNILKKFQDLLFPIPRIFL